MANPTVRVGFLGDASQLAREARRAQDSLDGISRHAHTTSTALGTALGTAAGRGIGAIAGAARSALGSIGALASTSIQAASDMNESLSKNQAVFGSSAASVKAWADDNSKNILLTKQAAIEGASTFGNLFVALGVGQGAAAGLSTKLVGLAEDLSSFNNVGTDEALLALRSGLLGEAEPLRKFGVSLSQSRIEAEAFALGLAKPVKNAAAITAAHNSVAAATAKVTEVEKVHGKGTLAAAQAHDVLARANAGLTKALAGQKVELTAAQKAQAAYSIILKDTKTAQGDAARTSGGYANSTRILQKSISDLEASLGQKLLPYALRATHALSDLVEQFDKGTGAGGRLREDLVHLGQDARSVGNALKPVVGAARWFVEHPDAFRLAAEGMGAYLVVSKSAAIWNGRLAASLPAVALGEAAVADASIGAAAGIGAVGTAATLALPEIAALTAALVLAYETWKIFKSVSDGGGDKNHAALGDDPSTYNYTFSDPNGMLSPYNQPGLPPPPDDHGKHRGALTSAPVAAQSTANAKAVTDDADKAAAAQTYAADQAAAAAKKKSDAADALQAATQKLSDALQSRLDTAKGIRDSLISSNSIVRDGVSWTAKDLLSRFTLTMDKVKRFQSALSSLVAKGFDPTIVSQVAAAGVQGGLGTAVGLAHASAGQVRQINATQRAISGAAGSAGDRVAGQMGPIQITTNLVVSDKVLATAVNRWNARNGYNGSRLAS